MVGSKSASKKKSFHDIALEGAELLDDDEISFFQEQVDEEKEKSRLSYGERKKLESEKSAVS
ncbi:MAG: hypothetical protein FWB91_06890 [Defluviitaleaceae bacterium]|nr:hypothetical protein [Defluviitaleaceae bacterium]